MMTQVREYKAYRRAYIALNHKIMEHNLKHDRLQRSAELLGIVRRGIMVFQDEEETSVLMDFALHEDRDQGKNAIALYQETIGEESAIERAILKALVCSRTSLFRIISASPTEGTSTLRDLLTDGQPVGLMDIGLSQSADPDYLLFVRLVPFQDMFITSGISFVFPPHLERFLLEKYQELREKTEPDKLSQERFIYFFTMS